MTKHRTSRRRRRRSQKGGSWYNPSSWFGSSDQAVVPIVDQNAPKKSIFDSITDSANNAVSGASNALTNVTTSATQGASAAVNGASDTLNSNVDLTGSIPVEAPIGSPYNPSGGRRRRKMKGGKGGLGLTYYATPVSGLNVAKPTYWIPNQSIKGGSRRKRRQRKSRKSRKSRKTRRQRKH